jgi:hypothetical protein
MEKLNVKELREELMGEEMKYNQLDNFMMENGYVSVEDEGATEFIKDDQNVVYKAEDTLEYEVQIFFNIIEDEGGELFTLKVTDVQKFF